MCVCDVLVCMGAPLAEYCCGSVSGSGCRAGLERCFVRLIDHSVISPVTMYLRCSLDS
jgi:hypothetical protein